MLIVEEIAKSFGSQPTVADVSLTVERGEVVGLLGPNGAGKTTTFRMITGVLLPDHGRILLDGDDITRMPLYERARRGMSYLPQEPSAFRSLSVEDNVLMVLEGHVADAARRKRLLGALLREFGLEDIRRVRASRLSGGQRRRCEIARALASNPSYILLDEPFAGIDPLAASEIQILVRNFTRLGFGVLITDHNVRETLSLVDRAYVIDQGRVLMKGTPDAVVAHPGVRSVYLGESFRL